MFDIRAANLRAINSLTKYPSIPTYHALDTKGGLLEAPTVFTGDVIATEKVDGTNSRIVLLPDGSWLLGSREELLHAKGDLIANPALGIVEQLKPVAEAIPAAEAEMIRVLYLELYGGKIGGNARQYTTDPARHGWRLFDVALLAVDDKLDWPSQRISAWRESGGQTFADEDQLTRAAQVAGLDLTPRLFVRGAALLPDDIDGMHQLLAAELPETRVGLGRAGRAEGIVFRTSDRSVIAKARFQDYERTARRRGGAR